MMGFKRITQGVSVMWLRFVVTLLVGIFQLPILYASFDRTVLGIYMLFFTMANFLALADLGLGTVVTRAVSYLKGSQGAPRTELELKAYSKVNLSDLLVTACASYAVACGGIFAIGAFAGIMYFDQLSLTPAVVTEVSGAWVIFLVAMGIGLLSNVPFAYLTGSGNVAPEQVIRLIHLITRFAAVVILAPLTRSVMALAVAELVAALVLLLASLILLWTQRAEVSLLAGRPRLALAKTMVTQALPMFITRVGALIILETTPLIVSFTMGPAMVPDFVALKTLAFFGLTIANSVPQAISPYIALAHSAGNPEQVLRYHSLTLRLTMALAIFWFVSLLTWAPNLTRMWLGEAHFLGYAAVVPLALMVLLEVHHTAHSMFTWNTGKWPFAPWGIASGILTLALAIPGGIYWGYAGIALGGMTAQLLTNNWYVVYFTLRNLRVSIRDYGKNVVAPLMGLGIAVASFAMLLSWVLETHLTVAWVFRGATGAQVLSVLVGGGLTFVFFGLLAWQILLQVPEKQWLFQRFRRQVAAS